MAWREGERDGEIVAWREREREREEVIAGDREMNDLPHVTPSCCSIPGIFSSKKRFFSEEVFLFIS